MTMLRFDQRPSGALPRNYLARGEQTRLLAMLAALALVVVAISQVNSPRGKRVLSALFGGGPPARAASGDAAQPDVQVGQDDQLSQTAGSISDAQSWLSASQQQTIRDNTTFLSRETDAWFAVFARLQEMAPDAAQALPVTYAQLARQPAAYRGRPVAVSGYIARVEREKSQANDLGLEEYWRVIFRPQGREVWPIAVYTLEKPAGVESGEEPYFSGRAVGVFFKNLSYQSQSGAGVMPVLLARQVEIDLPAPSEGAGSDQVDSSDLPKMLAIGLSLAAVTLLLIVVRERSR